MDEVLEGLSRVATTKQTDGCQTDPRPNSGWVNNLCTIRVAKAKVAEAKCDKQEGGSATSQ